MTFQCPEGRYSSALPRIAGVTSKVKNDLELFRGTFYPAF